MENIGISLSKSFTFDVNCHITLSPTAYTWKHRPHFSYLLILKDLGIIIVDPHLNSITTSSRMVKKANQRPADCRSHQ